MLLVAFRNIMQEKGRLFISLAGVTFAIILMLVLLGIYSGAIKQFTRFIDENPTDLVVAQKGISDYFHGASLIPKEKVAQIATEPGVKKVVPMLASQSIAEHEGKKFDVFITSFIHGESQGAPWTLSEGTANINDTETVISSVLAKKLDKSVGDTIKLSSEDFVIKGLVPEATSFGTNYAWITYQKAQALQKQPVVSFIYIKLDNSSDTGTVTETLKQSSPDLSVLTKAEFKENNKAELEEVFLPIIGAIVVIAVIVGTAVIGLTIYTATIDKIREYGVLKAIGVSNGQLFQIVAAQSLLIVGLGFVLGLGISLLASGTLGETIGIPPIITVPIILGTAGLSIVMGIIASLAPLKRLLSIDPAEVFKA